MGGTSNGKSTEASVAIDTASRVPVGATTIPVASAATFVVGDEIIVERNANDAWLTAVGMAAIPSCTGSCNSWTAPEYTLKFYREITAIAGNVITIDLPLTQAITSEYGGGSICAPAPNPTTVLCSVVTVRVRFRR